jgi:hypothetical protein
VGKASTAIAVNITTDKYPPIDLMFQKFSGGARAGFNVGTGTYSVGFSSFFMVMHKRNSIFLGRAPYGFDVVLSGITMPLWNKNIFPNGGFHTTTGTQNNDTFYIWMNDPEVVQPFSVSVESRVPIILAGPAAHGGVATRNESLALSVIYNCSGPILDQIFWYVSYPSSRLTLPQDSSDSTI